MSNAARPPGQPALLRLPSPARISPASTPGEAWLHVTPTPGMGSGSPTVHEDLGPPPGSSGSPSTSPQLLAAFQVMKKLPSLIQSIPVSVLTHGIRTAMFLGCKNSCGHGRSGAGPWPTPPCQLAAPAPVLAWQNGQQHPEHGVMPRSPRPPCDPPYIYICLKPASWRPSVLLPHL